jgi:hypothetical protein
MTSPASEEPLTLDPKAELPKVIQEELDNISEPQEDIRVAVSSDMNLDGDFEDCWFVATNRRILVFSGNHGKRSELVREIPIRDVNEVKLKNYVGNGVLEVRTVNKAIELLRFSRTAFHKSEIGIRSRSAKVMARNMEASGDIAVKSAAILYRTGQAHALVVWKKEPFSPVCLAISNLTGI